MLAQVRAELYKLSSLSLCSNTIGQLATGIMINPPKPGDPSFETFKKVRMASRTLNKCMMSLFLGTSRSTKCCPHL